MQQPGVARRHRKRTRISAQCGERRLARRTSRRARTVSQQHGHHVVFVFLNQEGGETEYPFKPVAAGERISGRPLTWCKRVNVGTRLFLPLPGTSSTCGPMTAFSARAFCSQLADAALDLARIHAAIERMSRIAAKKPPAIPEISSGSSPLVPHSRPAHRPADKTAKPVAP